MPFELTERQAAMMSTRLMLQAPPNLTPRQLANVRRDLDRRVRGLPGDVFMALDALRLLADQGNTIAADLFDMECRRLGLTSASFSHGGAAIARPRREG